MMDAALGTSLDRLASAPRLRRYRDAATHAGVTDDMETAVLYCWNIQLAEALLPSIAIFEVSLRNAVHTALTAYAGSDLWFQQVLRPKQPKRCQKVEWLTATIQQRQGFPPSADKLISEFTLGFWSNIFAKTYNPLWWTPPVPRLTLVLPNHPNVARDTRAKLEQRLEYFVVLRNRAVHHEALFQGVAALNQPKLSLDVVHRQLIESIGWINADARRIAVRLDRFDTVYQDGQRLIEAGLRAEFGS